MTAGEGVVTMQTLEPLGFCDPSVFIEFLALWQKGDPNAMIGIFRRWAPLIGPEAFLKGLEDTLNREIMTAVGVEQGRSERRAMLRLTMAELWQCIQRVWRVIDAAHLDLGRVEVTLICTLLKLGEEKVIPTVNLVGIPQPPANPVAPPAQPEGYKEPPLDDQNCAPVDPEAPQVCSDEEVEKLLNE